MPNIVTSLSRRETGYTGTRKDVHSYCYGTFRALMDECRALIADDLREIDAVTRRLDEAILTEGPPQRADQMAALGYLWIVASPDMQASQCCQSILQLLAAACEARYMACALPLAEALRLAMEERRAAA